MNGAPAFERYIGIDYSGAETPDASLKGLRVYSADCAGLPEEVLPPPSGMADCMEQRRLQMGFAVTALGGIGG